MPLVGLILSVYGLWTGNIQVMMVGAALVGTIWLLPGPGISRGRDFSDFSFDDPRPADVWIEAAQADYVAGKIEVEQLEVDLEQALAGGVPARMRSNGPPEEATRPPAPNGAPRTPQIVGRPLSRGAATIDAATPSHTFPDPWAPRCLDGEHVYRGGAACRPPCPGHTCMMCGAGYIEHR